MKFTIQFNQRKTYNRHRVDIIKYNNIDKELIITYNPYNEKAISDIEEIINFLNKNKFIMFSKNTKNKLIEFTTIKFNDKSNIYYIKNVQKSDLFKDIDERYLYINLVRSYKTNEYFRGSNKEVECS